MDTYADDLAELVEALDLQRRDPRRPLDRRRRGRPLHRPPRHEARREGRADQRGSAADAEDAPPIPADCRSRRSTSSARASLADRSQFFKDLSAAVLRRQPPGAKVSQGLRDSFWLQGMQCGLNGAYDCIKAFSETDFTEDLKKIDVPTLILHGDDDQIVPIGAAAMMSVEDREERATRRSIRASRTACARRRRTVNADLLAFVEAKSERAAA